MAKATSTVKTSDTIAGFSRLLTKLGKVPMSEVRDEERKYEAEKRQRQKAGPRKRKKR